MAGLVAQVGDEPANSRLEDIGVSDRESRALPAIRRHRMAAGADAARPRAARASCFAHSLGVRPHRLALEDRRTLRPLDGTEQAREIAPEL
jgi:hypothetical protein